MVRLSMLERSRARLRGVVGRGLLEALGEAERKDFPILRGRERVVEADFLGSRGRRSQTHLRSSLVR